MVKDTVPASPRERSRVSIQDTQAAQSRRRRARDGRYPLDIHGAPRRFGTGMGVRRFIGGRPV
jgi:hypothetical protein